MGMGLATKSAEQREKEATSKQKQSSTETATRTPFGSAELWKAIEGIFMGGLSGQPSDVQNAWWRTGKERIGKTYGNLATEATEALAGRGAEGGGAMNRVLSNLQTSKAGAMSNLAREGVQMNYDDLLKKIALAFGYGGLGGTTTGTSTATGTSTQAPNQIWLSLLQGLL